MSKLPRKLPRLNFQHVLFGFGDALEKLFFDDFYRISLNVVRVALILHIALYALFGILDIWIVPLSKIGVWIIRYSIVCPLLIIVLVLTFFDIFKRYMQIMLSIVSYISGLGIVVMIGLSAESELGFKFYYAGLMLVLMWVYALARLRFIYGTSISWLITISYEIVAITINKMLQTPENLMVFINNNFFFISANVIGMFASFTIEWYMRKNYLLRLEVEKSFNLNQKYLDNIKEGLLLLDENYIILDQYSEYLTGMFEKVRPEGTRFIDLVFPDKERYREERAELERFLHFLFHNKSADIDMIMSINPFVNRKIEIKTNEFVTKEIILNADFIRIYDKESVEYVMVIFQDITEVVKFETQLQEQKIRFEQEAEFISAILKSGPALFSDFLEEARLILNSIRSNVNNISDKRILNKVFREAHSLKGSAKHLELNHISTIAHTLEDLLVKSRDNPDQDVQKLAGQIEEIIVDLFREFQNLSKMIDKLKMFSTLNVSIKTDDWKGALGEFLRSLPAMVESLSRELNKEVKIDIENNLEDIPHLSLIKNPIIHIIRNSVDHGIEDQFERLTKNKSATGKIFLKLYDTGSSYFIEIEDDGAGINFDLIHKKGLERNLIAEDKKSITKSKLLQLIFTPSFSSKSEVTEISGRGYGLDIVKDAADQLGGKILVQTKKDKGTKISFTFPH